MIKAKKRLGQNLSIGLHRLSLAEGTEITYAGEIIREFLGREGISLDSMLVQLQKVTSKDTHLYSHLSKKTLSEIISGMMLFSNNFIANQLLLTIGLKRYGAPASLRKGKMAISKYLNKE